jgi:hypothetical protein
MTQLCLAIDPGNTESAYVFLDKKTYTPIEHAKVKNETLREILLQKINDNTIKHSFDAAIEMVASYGLAVGREVFETCVWIGRFAELLESNGIHVTFIYRKDVKMNLCGQTKAKDSNIRMSLIDRFATHDLKNGKGTKSNPDFFAGFKSDIWAAMAVGVTHLDTLKALGST